MALVPVGETTVGMVAMRVQIAQPTASAQELQAFFGSTLPQHEHFSRGGHAVVGAGLVTGVVVKQAGPHALELGWEIPNIGVKLLMVFSIFAGILPGLLLWGLVWMVISGDVERLKQEIAQALTTGAPVQAGGPMMGGAPMMMRPAKPGGAAMAFGVLFTMASLAAFAYAAYMFDRAESADRIAASSSSYGSSSYGSGRYGSTYRSALGPEFWSSLARRRREEALASGGGGLVNLLIAVGLFATRRSKVRAWEAQLASGAAPMGMPQQGYMQPPQGYGPPQQGYGPPQQGYGPPQQGYGPPQQGQWPPGGQGPMQG